MMTTESNITPELQAILTAVLTTPSNILISACAGGGKTTAGVAIAKALGSGLSFVSLAFNKDAALSLQSKMPYWVRSATFHSYCNDALVKHLGYRPTLDAQRTKKILRTLVQEFVTYRELEEPVLKLVSIAKACGHTASAACDISLSDIADRFGMDNPRGMFHYAQKILDICAFDTEPKTIDFDDQLWLALRLSVPFPPAAFIFLDEAQDTNGVQRALLSRMLASGGRLIAVGDPHQSIYGFRGADSDAMPTLKSDFNMIELPLSVSWRCSQAVVREAQKYL